jgi:hypothetical protein
MPVQKMKLLRSQRPLQLVVLMVGVAGVWRFTHCRDKQTDAGHRPIISFATVTPVLEAVADKLPPQLREPNETKWKT